MAYDSQIVRAKENPKLSHDGPIQKHASGTNQQIKALRQGRHWAWGCHTVVQMKRNREL